MIIFDELAYVERLLSEGYIRKDKIRKDLFILYKYYKYMGYSQFQTAKMLFRFIKEHNDYVYKGLEETLKISIINGIKDVWECNYKFRTGVEIKLSRNELETVKAQKTNGEKQVLFVMIVLSKFFKTKSNTFYAHVKDICGLTGLYYNKEHIKNIIEKLANNGYIKIVKQRRSAKTKDGKKIFYEKIYYTCIISVCNDIVYAINKTSKNQTLMKDFSHSMRIVDKDFRYCEVCGEEFVPQSNAHLYCSICWQKLRKIQIKIINKRYYNKLRSNRNC